MRNRVQLNEVQDAQVWGHRWLEENAVRAVVIDIRGCKPIDPDTFEALKCLFDEARDHGVNRFVRIGDGTLCAVQMHALERAAHVSERTLIFLDDSNLPT
jgi:hypothetical protein